MQSKSFHPPPDALAAALVLFRKQFPSDFREDEICTAFSQYLERRSQNNQTIESQPVIPIGTSVTVREAARRLGVSRSTVFSLLKNGKLQRLKLGSRTLRIPEAALARLVDNKVLLHAGQEGRAES